MKEEPFGLILNDKFVPLKSIPDVISSSFDIILLRSKYASLDAIKKNIEENSQMVIELCDLRYDELMKIKAQDTATKKSITSEKSALSRMKKKMLSLSEFSQKKLDRESLLSMLYDFKLSMEGVGLLRGFQYTHKVHKDKPRHNAERMSLLKVT
jgi:hypothetical protein